MVKKVVIDAGHGGSDPGAIGVDNYNEKDATLSISKKVVELLKKQGLEVKLTRDSDKYISLQERCNIANNYAADCFVSIHCNAFNGKAKGLESFCLNSKTSDLATYVLEGMLNEKTYTLNRGIKFANYYVLKNTKMPSIILEVDFISNEAMEENIKVNTRNIAKVIYKNILKLYGLNDIENTSNNEIKYRVVIGAFNNKDNATKILEEAKRKGFTDSYIM